MIIDSFLFFQELDLLEIRLNYLDEFVDKFVIIESCQTFNGKKKEFNFEKTKHRFRKFINKIIYYKIEDYHNSPEALYQHLSNHKYSCRRLISKLMDSHLHYDKTKLWWVLDSYHRECIHYVLREFCSLDDLIIFSDLDEIPSSNVFYLIKKNKELKFPLVCRQHEFKYYLNSHNNSKWLGSIIAPYSYLKDKSLNTLRIGSYKLDKVNNGGYHFTSVGGINLLKLKIENWGHQEFNKPEIKNNLKRNLSTGRDIFYRLGIPKNKIIDIEKDKIFDKKMKKIIKNYKKLHIVRIKENIVDVIRYRYIQLKIYKSRIRQNPLKVLNKLKKILIKSILEFSKTFL